jgi:hypothetical protein
MNIDQEETSDFEPEPDDDDIPGEITPSQLERISLSATDWTAETLLSQIERGNIDLSPRFQRRDAWQRDRKSKFVESLILNFPVPQIVLAEQRNARGRFIVLDGKQRLTALLKFAGKAADGEPLNGFALTSMDVLTHLNRRSYEDMVHDDALADELNALHNQTIRTVVIRNWDTDALLHLIFVRLNTSSVPLSPQELRQALYPGEFVNYIDDRSYGSSMLKKFMGLQHADFRMRDVEILLRFLAFSFYIENYSGNMSQFLNLTTERLNDRFVKHRADVEQAVDDFESALQASIDIFGIEHVARKWTGSKFEKRWNRAILDVLLYYFSDASVRDESVRRKNQVINAYKQIFVGDSRFRDAVAATTKSLSATHDRFVLWGEALTGVLDAQVGIPDWDPIRNRFVLRARSA